MLSYQHIYHAGGWADLHKHAVLCALWVEITAAAKCEALTYIDTHAGRGLYDLGTPEANKIAEYKAGIDRLDIARLPKNFAAYAKAVKACAPLYPGSPGCIAALKRKTDKMQLFEMHPGEIKHLQNALGKKPKIKIKKKDGHAGVIEWAAKTPDKNALVLMDPSYEIKSEYAQTAQTALKILSASSQAKVLIWYPQLAGAPRFEALLQPLQPLIEEGKAIHSIMTAPFDTPPAKGMTASGLILLNPPANFAEKITAMTELLERVLRKRD